MKINSLVVVIIVLVVVGGGIIITNALDLWSAKPILQSPAASISSVNTDNASGSIESVPNFNTPYKPDGIRGTNTFAEISLMFNVPLMDLGIGFDITSEPDWQNLKARELKTIYTNLPPDVKLETESVRAFISLYTGKPYKYSDTSYLPGPAVDILKQKARLSAEQTAFLDSHTYNAGMTASTGTSNIGIHTVTGEVSFQTLLNWGISASEIEKTIGDKIPSGTTMIRAYADQEGKDFLVLVSALQELANKY